jgi:hypothetical protein
MQFWEQAEKNISTLDLLPDVLSKIIDGLEKAVPKPSKEEFEQWHEAQAAALRRSEERISQGRR